MYEARAFGDAGWDRRGGIRDRKADGRRARCSRLGAESKAEKMKSLLIHVSGIRVARVRGLGRFAEGV